MDERHADFTPAWWLRGRHAQTTWGRLARSRRQVLLRREALIAPDGDTLLVDHLAGTGAGGAQAPRLLILHGLEGSSNSVYAQGLLALAARAGLRASVLNFRYCARDASDRCVPNERPRLYHSGETSDLDFVARTLAARDGRSLVAAGISLGGNALLKWLGEHPNDPTISAAATLSVPYDLAAGDRYMASFPTNLYVRAFVKTLAVKAENLMRRFPDAVERVDLGRARRARTFREFDAAATAPLHGFAGADDYYARSSSLPFLARITIPTLCISALDDPFLPPEATWRARDAASSAVRFVVTERGGHAGFVAARGVRPVYWAEEAIVAFLARFSSHARGTDDAMPAPRSARPPRPGRAAASGSPPRSGPCRSSGRSPS